MGYQVVLRKETKTKFKSCLGELQYTVRELKQRYKVKFETLRGSISLDDILIIRTDSQLEYMFYYARGTSAQNATIFYESDKDINTCFRDLIENFPIEPQEFTWIPEEVQVHLLPYYQLCQQDQMGKKSILKKSFSRQKLLLHQKKAEKKILLSYWIEKTPITR